ncbi:MAG: hypothetical protein PHR83_16470 [Paludibacter sp.]|nr:hypothetical protein [Paludibacter sp.]
MKYIRKNSRNELVLSALCNGSNKRKLIDIKDIADFVLFKKNKLENQKIQIRMCNSGVRNHFIPIKDIEIINSELIELDIDFDFIDNRERRWIILK